MTAAANLRDGDGPLRDLRVLEIAEGIAGPVCGLQYADLGATVYKLEPPDGDRAREWGPPMAGDDAAIFAHLNRGKKSVMLDLAGAEDRRILERILPWFDVVVVHMDPLEREECGIDWRAMQHRFPRVVLCEINDMGPVGPYAGRAGSELILQALAGFPTFVGQKSGARPCRVGYEVGSVGAGMHAYIATMAGIYWRQRKNEGQYIAISALGQLLSQLSIMFAARHSPDNWSGFHLNGPQWNPDIGWETSDGQVTFDFRHGEREGWAKFCAAVGLGHIPDHPDYKDWRSTIYIGDRKDEYGDVYRPAFKRLTSEQASGLINDFGGISVKFNNFGEYLNHPQVRFIDPLDRVPDAPEAVREQIGSPFRMVGVPAAREHAPAPRLDADRAALFAACRVDATAARR